MVPAPCLRGTFCHLLFAFFFIRTALAQLDLYAGGLFLDNVVSSQCSSAINAQISCDPYLISLTSADSFGALNDTSLQASICTDTCGQALSTYHKVVTTACAQDLQPWDGLPAEWAGDAIWATYNRTCLKDSSGHYCGGKRTQLVYSLGVVDRLISNQLDFIGNLDETLAEDIDLAAIPHRDLCAPCMLALLVQAQSTAYSNYGPGYVDQYKNIQSICNVEHPTEVQQPPTNISNYYNFANSAYEPACLSGKTYRVAVGDNCQKIAASQGVATGTLEAINNIYPGCTNLIAGSTICLPQICQTYLVQPGDTCWSIASAHDVSYSTFSGYNPTINGQCSNLLSGINVCISPAAGTYTPSTIAGATVTQVGVYATTTIMPPSPTPFGTTAQCGRYYQAQSGDYCQQISLNNSISVPLFEEINPSINDACTNLNPGFYYCVFPTQNWNETSSGGSSITVGAPAPTPSGTTNACYTWHTVVTGDYCAKLQQQYSVTLAQLQRWNPQLNAACDNLLLGDAYCVLGK
ncbi:MAG: hypothetical protein Q9178_001187 [Gyalolechia marmorata]